MRDFLIGLIDVGEKNTLNVNSVIPSSPGLRTEKASRAPALVSPLLSYRYTVSSCLMFLPSGLPGHHGLYLQTRGDPNTLFLPYVPFVRYSVTAPRKVTNTSTTPLRVSSVPSELLHLTNYFLKIPSPNPTPLRLESPHKSFRGHSIECLAHRINLHEAMQALQLPREHLSCQGAQSSL